MLALLVTAACLATPPPLLAHSATHSATGPNAPVVPTVTAPSRSPAEEREEVLPDGRVARFEVRSGRDGELVRHGTYREHFAGGALACEGRYKDGRRIGRWTHYWANGEKRADGPYRAEARHGKWRHYRLDGTLEAEGIYRDGERVGAWTRYDERGAEVDTVELDRHRYADAAGRTWEGATVAGQKSGLWTCTRASGAPLLVGVYAGGLREGPWACFAADGTLFPEWITGVWERGRRTGELESTADLATLLAAGEHELAALPVPGTAVREPDERTARWTAELERWLASDGTERAELRARLAAARREAWRAITETLAGCDLADEASAARAQTIHAELLTHLAGAAWPWTPGTSPDAVAANRRVVHRWDLLGELSAEDDALWEHHLEPARHFRSFELADTRLTTAPEPPELAEYAPPDVEAENPEPRYGARKTALYGTTWTEPPVERATRRVAEAIQPDGSVEGLVGATATAALALNSVRPLLDDEEGDEGLRAVLWLATHREQGSVSEQLVATHALLEAAYFTRLPALRAESRDRVQALLASRAADGGFPLAAGGAGHPGATAVGLIVLMTAKDLGVAVDDEVTAELLRFLEAHTDAARGTTRAGEPDPWVPWSEPAVTAATCLARVFGGELRARLLLADDPQVLWLTAHPPTAEDVFEDPHYLVFGGCAAFQAGRVAWRRWNEAMEPMLAPTQRQDGTWSWPGRSPAVAAALGLTALVSYGRYARVTR